MRGNMPHSTEVKAALFSSGLLSRMEGCREFVIVAYMKVNLTGDCLGTVSLLPFRSAVALLMPGHPSVSA